jgi:uncharacterized protein (UPF0332 family)
VSSELLATARRLAAPSRSRPRQADLKRAISTAYYALFHAIARSNADRFVGVGTNRADRPWNQTYRALDHNAAFKACGNLAGPHFSPGLIQLGVAFRTLQEQRHKADYDPHHRVSLQDALASIATAEAGLSALKAATNKERTALAAHLLFKTR